MIDIHDDCGVCGNTGRFCSVCRATEEDCQCPGFSSGRDCPYCRVAGDRHINAEASYLEGDIVHSSEIADDPAYYHGYWQRVDMKQPIVMPRTFPYVPTIAERETKPDECHEPETCNKLHNESGHHYGCECHVCMQEYWQLKR